MGWIEAINGTLVNLDQVVRIFADWEESAWVIRGCCVDGGVVVLGTDPNPDGDDLAQWFAEKPRAVEG